MASPPDTTPVEQSGSITPGHAVSWTTDGVVQDAGTPNAGNLTGVGIVNPAGTALGITTGPPSGAFNLLGLGFDETTGNAELTVTAFNGAPLENFQITVNGVTETFPFGGGGGSPGGPTGSIQYNNAGVFGGYPLGANLAIVGGTLSVTPAGSDGQLQWNLGGTALGGLTIGANLSVSAGALNAAGGGSPGGSSGNVQYNNAGAFAGLTDTQLTGRIQSFSSFSSGAVPAPGVSTGRVLFDSGWGSPGGLSLTEYNWFNVVDHGATGNGITNDTAAFNATISACAAAGGGDVWVPIGKYLIDPITIPANVTIRGTVPGPFEIWSAFLTPPKFPILLINSHASAFITLADLNASIQDVAIFDPGQVIVTASAPVVFPPQIQTTAGKPGSKLRGITIVNAYDGIKLNCGRAYVEDCQISAFHIGLAVDNSADFVWVSNVIHTVAWNFVTGASWPQNIDSWVMQHGIAFQFARQDAAQMVDCGCFGREIGLNLIDGSSGPSYGVAANLTFDTVNYGITAHSTNNLGGGWQITNLWVGANSPAIGMSPQTAIWLEAGGAQAPTVTVISGFVSSSIYWAFGPTEVSAGVLKTKHVANIPDFGTQAIALNTGPFVASGVWNALTSVTLPPGDYEIWGLGMFDAASPGAAQIVASISTSPSGPASGTTGLQNTLASGSYIFEACSIPAGHGLISITTQTTYYLVMFALFSGAFCQIGGYIGWKKV